MRGVPSSWIRPIILENGSVLNGMKDFSVIRSIRRTYDSIVGHIGNDRGHDFLPRYGMKCGCSRASLNCSREYLEPGTGIMNTE